MLFLHGAAGAVVVDDSVFNSFLADVVAVYMSRLCPYFCC